MTQLSTSSSSCAVADPLYEADNAFGCGDGRSGTLSCTARAGLSLARALAKRGRVRALLIIGILPAGFTLGYLFYLGCAAGFLISKFCGGAESGIQGRVRSIIIPLRTHELHLHHWLLSVVATVASAMQGFFLIAPGLFYGILGGLILQGILCYEDWHRILKRRNLLAVFDVADSCDA